ncbi:MAG: putative phosphate transport regulator [Gemmatimonadetes bacterium]|nr:putative phosphate transport regulator [Gemmatimonadota bacterium]
MRLIPRDEKFFELFAEIGVRLTRCAELVCELFAEPHRTAELVRSIKELEHEADDLTRGVIERIDKSFVTPIDREDIHLLASALDNVVDLLDGTARRVEMFHITETKVAAQQLAEVLLRAARQIEQGVGKMKRPKDVSANSVAVKALEEEGDAIYHRAVGELFAGTPDPLEVIKWKEIYDTLERAIDQCEDVANVIQSVALKNG